MNTTIQQQAALNAERIVHNVSAGIYDRAAAAEMLAELHGLGLIDDEQLAGYTARI